MSTIQRLAASLLACVLLASACGDSGAPDTSAAGVASLRDDDTTDAGGAPAARQDFQEAVLDVAACLREQGFEVADPTFDAEGNPVLSPDLAPDIDLASSEFLDAFDECASILQDALPNEFAALDPELQAQVRDNLGQFAQCMRDEGVESFPDPRPTGNPFQFRDMIALGADPDIDAAQEACQPLLQFATED